MLAATEEQKINYIGESINQLLSKDIAEATIRLHVCKSATEYIRSIIAGARKACSQHERIAIVEQHTSLLARAPKSTQQDCRECLGVGQTTHGLNLVEMLRKRPHKPLHFTPSEPKQAPANCR